MLKHQERPLEHFVIEMLSESSGARLRRSDGVAVIHLRRNVSEY